LVVSLVYLLFRRALAVAALWPFQTFASPTAESEKRLYIDTDFFVCDETGREVSGSPLTRMELLWGLTVIEVSARGQGLSVAFDGVVRL
jgi:hypothetical protein